MNATQRQSPVGQAVQEGRGGMAEHRLRTEHFRGREDPEEMAVGETIRRWTREVGAPPNRRQPPLAQHAFHFIVGVPGGQEPWPERERRSFHDKSVQGEGDRSNRMIDILWITHSRIA
ncbi:hypothetical protein [Pseudonocardia sp. GCM10023141]|uniref:hypothetical protein n=1 Tax=Pseudonocardia sp. GCM10023141 TaxID=3252653 RepID=UPI00361E7456